MENDGGNEISESPSVSITFVLPHEVKNETNTEQKTASEQQIQNENREIAQVISPVLMKLPSAMAAKKRGSIMRSLSSSDLKKDEEGEPTTVSFSIQAQTISSDAVVKIISPRSESANDLSAKSSALTKRKTMAMPKRFTDVVPSDILESLSAKELRRQEIIFEIVNTERQYVKDLFLLIEVRFSSLYIN